MKEYRAYHKREQKSKAEALKQTKKKQLEKKQIDVGDKERKLLSKLSGFHIQARMHADVTINVLGEHRKKMFELKISGFDFSVCNPSGPLTAKLGVMMRKLRIDHWIHSSQLQKIEKKKKGIFETEQRIEFDPDDVMHSPRHLSVKSGRTFREMTKFSAVPKISKIQVGEYMVSRVFDYQKVKMLVDLETQRSLTKQIIYIVQVKGGTGRLNITIGEELLRRVEQLNHIYIEENKDQIENQLKKMKTMMEVNVANTLNTIEKGIMDKDLAKFEHTIVNKMKKFSDLKPSDFERGNSQYELTQYQRDKLRARYEGWFKEKYSSERSRIRARQEAGLDKDLEGKSTREQLNIIAENLRKGVIKVDFSIDPVNIALTDHTDEIISCCDLDFGRLELLVDEIYTKRHLFKCLGVRVESRKSLRVLGSLIEVSGSVIF